jgi:hypothetical protein
LLQTKQMVSQPPAAQSIEATLAEVLTDNEEAALRFQYAHTLCGWVTCGRKTPPKHWRAQWIRLNAAREMQSVLELSQREAEAASADVVVLKSEANFRFETEQALKASLSTADLLRSAADDQELARAEQMAMEASLDQQRLAETTAMAVKEQEAASMAAVLVESKRQAALAEREEAVTMERVVADSERLAAREALIERAEIAIQLDEIALAGGGAAGAGDADVLDGAAIGPALAAVLQAGLDQAEQHVVTAALSPRGSRMEEDAEAAWQIKPSASAESLNLPLEWEPEVDPGESAPAVRAPTALGAASAASVALPRPADRVSASAALEEQIEDTLREIAKLDAIEEEDRLCIHEQVHGATVAL